MRPIHQLTGLAVLLIANVAIAATERATYTFADTLSALEAGAPALIAADPLEQNTFETVSVFGQDRRVYRWIGNASASEQQGGLTLNTTGLIPANQYSLSMVFQFDEPPSSENNPAPSIYRRIVDVQDRTSDNGFYVDPNNRLNVYPDEAAGSTAWTNDTFHHVVLTNASTSMINVYLNGTLEFSVASDVMHVSNDGNLMHFFLDNVIGGGEGEYSNGRVALIRLYDGVLTGSEVSQIAADPFQALPVPEPETHALMLAGLGLIGYAAYRRRRS